METTSLVSGHRQAQKSAAQWQTSSTRVLAGNSRLELMADGTLKIEAQLRAFEAGLAFANTVSEQTGKLPPISVAFDHKGTFRTQFLREGLTNSQKRNPKLSELRDGIIEVFRPPAQKWEFPLSQIDALHEDSARSHARHFIANNELPPHILSRMVATATGALAPEAANSDSKVTCAAVTTEYFRKAADS